MFSGSTRCAVSKVGPTSAGLGVSGTGAHWASRTIDPNLPPMGVRVRLKNSVDIARYPKEAQVILRAFKKCRMLLADNGARGSFRARRMSGGMTVGWRRSSGSRAGT